MQSVCRSILSLAIVLLFSSCVSYPALLNFNEAPGIPTQPQSINNYQPITIQPNDILDIQISSLDPVATKPFLLSSGEEGGATVAGYLVNSAGEIKFPTLGRIYLKDLNTEAAADTILQLLAPYFEQEPIINVRVANFKVNVNGEVGTPGVFTIANERVSILDALSMAGDFTIYSRRDSILIIRERDEVRTFGYIDLNSSNAFNSPYFYLQQNDLVYVKPQKAKVNAVQDTGRRILPWVSAIASITAIAISIIRFR